MLLAVCKHGGQWDYLGRMFKIEGPTFEKPITKSLKVIADEFYEGYVLAWSTNGPWNASFSATSCSRPFTWRNTPQM